MKTRTMLVAATAVAGFLLTQPWSTSSTATSSTGTTNESAPKLERGPVHPRQLRAEMRRIVQRDENGVIPHDAIMKAKAELAALPLQANAAGLDPTKWVEDGPGNIGGRIRSIVIHPRTPATMFVGSVSGGIWRTTNSGASWARVDDKLGNLAISTMILDPRNPSILYAGTGESFTAGGLRGAGIFKSTNGGTRWTRLASTNTRDFYYVNRLALSPDSRTLLAGCGGGGRASGIWRSTNGGTTWTRIYRGGGNAFCNDIKYHPTNSNIVVASIIDYDRANTTWFNNVIFSTNGGTTWTSATGIRANGFSTRIELAWHRGWTGRGNGCLYAQVNANGSSVYRSIDGGARWTRTSQNTRILGSQGRYDNTLWVDPDDGNADVTDDIVICGGIDLWYSSNGAATWQRISQWQSAPRSAHADHHFIVEHPNYDGNNNNIVFFGNDGGIYRADDVHSVQGTNGWVSLNNRLGITQFYGGSRHAGTNTLYGGTQDNGTLQTTTAKGANGWTSPFGGDGGFSASDPNDSRYHYGEYVYGNVHRSDDGGRRGSYISGNYWNGQAWVWKAAPYSITEVRTQSALFIAPFVLDPNNSNRLLVGCDSLWRTNDCKARTTTTTGPRWAAIKPPSNGLISAIAVAKGNSARIYIGYNDGEVWTTANGTAARPTWRQVDTGLPNRYVTRLVVDPKNANRVFATFGGFSANNIWLSTNAGARWTAFGNPPQIPIRDLEWHPQKPQWMYAATEVGLIVSENGGTSWSSAASGHDVSIDETFFSDGTLYLVTHGRGIHHQKPCASIVRTVGSTCILNGAAGGPRLTADQAILGRPMTFRATGAPTTSNVGVLLLGFPGNAPIRISPNCQLNFNVALPILTIGVMPIANGSGTLALPLPNDDKFACLRLAFHLVVPSRNGDYLTNSVDATLGR